MRKKPIEPSEQSSSKDVAEPTDVSRVATEELLVELSKPRASKEAIVSELLLREKEGDVQSMDDLLRILRHSRDDGFRMQVLGRVDARAHQLESRHLRFCLDFCGDKVKKWADLNRSKFKKDGQGVQQGDGLVHAVAV